MTLFSLLGFGIDGLCGPGRDHNHTGGKFHKIGGLMEGASFVKDL